MRVLLTANASYIPPRGGATRSNLLWLEQLAAAGYECRIVCAGLAGEDRARQLADEDLASHWQQIQGAVDEEVWRSGNLTVYAAADARRIAQALRAQIAAFQPDWVLVSSEDLGHTLLREAHYSAPGRVIYIGHTPQFFPFGPESWNVEPDGAELVARCSGIVTIGQHMAEYVRSHTGRTPAVVHPPIYGSGPWPDFANFDRGYLTILNPCAVKGMAVFLALADRMPEERFAAVPGWATTREDRAALAARRNVTVLRNTKDIEDLLKHTRVLLMPSLWYEGFGLIAMEAMLRGIPVIASDSGGLKEAKRGTGYVIPTEPIRAYLKEFDERAMPKPVLPAIDVAPWIAAVKKLTGDRVAYQEESWRSAEAARAFVVTAGGLEPVLGRRRLRILHAQNSLFYPAHGGGDKSNRLLIEALAARGHECRVVARIASFGERQHREYLETLARRGVAVTSSDAGVVVFQHNGVDVHVVTSHPNLRGYFGTQVEEFAPDVILTSTDDPAQLLLELALKSAVARVVYLARATQPLAFGPDCAFPSEVKTASLRRVDGIVGVSEYVARYIREYGGIDAVHVPLSLMEGGPFPELGRPGNEYVVMANPCAVKGIAIFLALADRMSDVQFAAVPTWGTNTEDRAALAARPNVRVLDPVDDMDELFAKTRVLLVPSLWAEARSRIVVEAMLRGVPVMASGVGGIPEAKMGVPYLLPVRPIEKYSTSMDDRMVPVPEVPEQDIGPWEVALRRLLSDPAHYREVAVTSRVAALEYFETLNVLPFERLLLHLPKKAVPAARPATGLSPERRQLLALRVRNAHRREDPWFPNARDATRRLFCLPHAGGGAAAFAGWPSDRFRVCAARLPGREQRSGEPPTSSMEELVEALGKAMQPYLREPFAFFGHSMGAVVGFELARWLRVHDMPGPKALLVSGARAPQFRRGHVPPPEPGEQEFTEQLRRLDGIPRAVLENPQLLELLLPALRADASLYNRFVYSEGKPLECPIFAYGGAEDPNVRQHHLEGWAEQTTAEFACHIFRGGHFFVNTAQAEFLRTLRDDLNTLE